MASGNKSKSFDVKELAGTREPILRRIVREELLRVLKEERNVFHLRPDMPLYEDMEDISRRKCKGQIKLHSHEEVWS